MRVLVLGIDGFCGLATALYLSRKGHEVTGIDSLIRRQWDHQLGIETLTPIREMDERLKVWNSLNGNSPFLPVPKKVVALYGDITDPEFLSRIVQECKPEAIIHFAEQRSAPYSMIDQAHAVFTPINNA